MRTAQRSRVHLGVVLCAALAVTACGSTVAQQPSAGGLVQDGAGSGLSPTGGAAGPPGAAGPGATGPGPLGAPGTAGSPGSAGAAAASGGGSTGSSGGSVAGAAGPGPAAAGAAGPGITPTTVFLGAPYFPDAAGGNAALGASGANSGDQRDYYKAVIDDLNKRGGILGRKVVPIYFAFKAQSTEPFDSQSETACNQWTKDNKVFAILYSGRVLEECARKAGALITGGGGEIGPVFDKLPNLIDATAVRLERLGAATVSGVSKQGYFQSSTEWPAGKVGVITWEDPAYRYGVTSGYVPALKRLGKTAKVIYVAKAQTLSGASDSSAAVSNAVLQFRSEGIDHVFIQDGPAGVFGLGGLTLLFLQNAKSQRFYPRYGFNPNNVPGYSIYPADEEHGMLAVDYSDYQPQQDEGISPNPARTRCFALMAQSGLKTNDINTQATAAGICNDVWLIETLLKRAASPTLRGAIAAAEGLGTTFRSPVVYGTRLGPGRHDGGELARAAKFDDGCSCMRFTSAPYAP